MTEDENRVHNRSEIAAFEEGREARLNGKSRDSVPQGYKAAKSLKKAFQNGWDSAIRVQEPVIRAPEPPVRTREGQGEDGVTRLPLSEALPENYRPLRPTPCVLCRAVLLPNTGRAVICKSTRDGIAYFYCKVCCRDFKLRIVDQ